MNRRQFFFGAAAATMAVPVAAQALAEAGNAPAITLRPGVEVWYGRSGCGWIVTGGRQFGKSDMVRRLVAQHVGMGDLVFDEDVRCAS